MSARPVLDVPTPPGGWLHPWPNVGQTAVQIGPEDWTLVGGLMVALHAAARGITLPRTTVDVDMVVHVETARGRVARIRTMLGGLGYTLMEPSDARKGHAHRFTRPGLAGGAGPESLSDIVDVMVADHPAPRVRERLGKFPMVAIDGGTQALNRTINARLEIDGAAVKLSVPDALGAVILKSAAHLADSRDPARHLSDAAVMLACMSDPFAERERLTSGSDRKRLAHLNTHLGDPNHPAWVALDADAARDGQAALRILLG
jgi:hypothetical protein